MSNEPNGNQNTSVLEENKIKAEEIKEAANKLFLAKKYEAAIEKYSEAINLNPNVAAYYANRSFAYFKTEAFGYAITDADKAIKLDPSYTKGYYRRAAANMNLCKFKDALRDFRIVMKRSPDDKDAKAKFTECEKS